MNRILLLVLLCCCCVELNAQQRKFTGGLLAGPVFSQISGDGLGGWDKLGFAAGGWVGVPLSAKSTIMLSMKYINKGSRTKRDTLDFNSFGYYLNYIDIPIVFNRRFTLARTDFSWSLGPYVGVLLDQKVIANKTTYSVPEASAGPEFETLDVGVMAGFAWWPNEKLFFELSTSTSLLPTRPAPVVVNPNSYYEQGNYNQTLQLMIGLRFGKNE